MKRKIQYIPILLLFTLSIISILSSYYGSKELVFNFSSPAQIVSLEVATADLDFQIANIDRQIDEARATKWAGTTTSDSQKTITSLNNQKEALLTEALRVREKTDLDNGIIEQEHLQEITINANHFALLTLLLELLFLASAFYLQYYDFRSYIEFYRPVSTVATTDKATLLSHQEGEGKPSTNSIPTNVLLGAIKNAKSNISAYRGKIKSGQGTVSANERGIKRWEQKLTELENLLPKNGVEHHA